MNHEHNPESQAPAHKEREVLTLPMSILISAVLLSASIFYYAWSGGRAPAPVENAPAGGNQPVAAVGVPEVGDRDVILGNPDAPVTVIEYGDFQCPFCARFYTESEKPIKDTYVKEGKVRLVYRDVAFLGEESRRAGNAAECAKDQGKFWAYHDKLYETEISDGEENNGNLTREYLLGLGRSLGMDMDKFTKCVDENTYANQLTKHRNDLAAAMGGALGTPAVFINGREVPGGARPYLEFKAVIEQALSR